jgi:uncharacterized membrane protein YcjF (UPF0283 family)
VVGVSTEPTSDEMPDEDVTDADVSDDGVLDSDLRRYLQIGGLGLASLFALVSAVGFYRSARRAIDVWIARQYQPAFDAGFNLVVLLAMLAVVVALLRRLE